MKGSLTRTAAWTLSIVLGLSAAVVPCAASGDQPGSLVQTVARTEPAAKPSPQLARLSPTSRRLLVRGAASAQQPTPEPAPSTPSSFFHSKRGALTLGLMGAGAVFTLWSIQHDRKPVKSPVR